MHSFALQYTSDTLPKQSHANMFVVKALHTQPDPSVPHQECSLKVSILPLRLNIDQVSVCLSRVNSLSLTISLQRSCTCTG